MPKGFGYGGESAGQERKNLLKDNPVAKDASGGRSWMSKHATPITMGHESPAKMGHESPAKMGHKSPATMGHKPPTKMKYDSRTTTPVINPPSSNNTVVQNYAIQQAAESKQYSGGSGSSVPNFDAEKYVSKQKIQTLGMTI